MYGFGFCVRICHAEVILIQYIFVPFDLLRGTFGIGPFLIQFISALLAVFHDTLAFFSFFQLHKGLHNTLHEKIFPPKTCKI